MQRIRGAELLAVGIWVVGLRCTVPSESSAAQSAAPPVASVTVSPDTLRLPALGASGVLTCTAKDKRGRVVVTPCTWSSRAAATVTVNPTLGRSTTALGRARGRTVVDAWVKNRRDSAVVEVACALSVGSAPGGGEDAFQTVVTVQPGTLIMSTGSSGATLQAQARDGCGPVAVGSWTWTSRNTGVVAAITSTKSAVTVAPAGAGQTYVVASAGGDSDSASVTVTAEGVAAHPADSTVEGLGVNVHLGYTDGHYYLDWTTTLARLDALNIRHLRDHAAHPGIWWHNTVRTRSLEAAAAGMVFSWISDSRMVTPAQGVQWADSLNEATGSIEGPNEWDLSQPPGCDWGPAHVLEQKQIDSIAAATPATAGLPIYGPSNFEAEATPACIQGISNYFDYMNLHAYPFPDPPEPDDDYPYQYNFFHTVYGDKPVMVTETGMHTGGAGSDRPVTVTQHGVYTPRLWFHLMNQGVRRIYLYELLDQCTEPANRECHFGLVYYDMSPKPGYTALQRIITLYADPGTPFSPGSLPYTLTGNMANVHQRLSQRRTGTFLLAVWLGVASGETAVTRDLALGFGSTMTTVNVYEPNTSGTAVQTVSNTNGFTLTVKDRMRIVEVIP